MDDEKTLQQAQENMKAINETVSAYQAGTMSEDEAGARVFHALFDRMMDK